MPLYPLKFAFSTEKGDRVEAVVTAPAERRCILHGTVYDAGGEKLVDAVVRLFVCDDDCLLPVADTFTDADGEFVLGPLDADKRFVAKVYTGGVMLREVTIRPSRKKRA